MHSFTLNEDKESKIMSGRKGFCVAQLFGVFLFCLGLVGGILIGMYAFSRQTESKVFCKNFPAWFINGYDTTKTIQAQHTTSHEVTTEPKIKDDYECSLCKTKSFTYAINNQLQEPYFNESVTLEIVDVDVPLIHYMESAVDEDNAIFNNFKVTYYSGMGYFINSINNVTANYVEDKTFWRVTTSSGHFHESISTFIPTDGTTVLVNFTSSSS